MQNYPISVIRAKPKIIYIRSQETCAGIISKKSRKALWSGLLTEDVFAEGIQKNAEIRSSKEALSDNIDEQNRAYAKTQGFVDIRDLLNLAFSPYRDLDYYIADGLTAEDAKQVYEKRISALREFLDSGEEHFSENEKAFLTGRYEALGTPFYYEYMDGWAAAKRFAPKSPPVF